MNDRIVLDPKICHGKPVIRGTRTPVTVILNALAGGDSFETLQREYDLTAEDIRACIAFAAGESIPPEVFEYRLGNRSALDWVIDQYQVSEDKRSGIRSDPNRADDEEYIVRLVGQVVRVSVETVKIVKGLPEGYGA